MKLRSVALLICISLLATWATFGQKKGESPEQEVRRLNAVRSAGIHRQRSEDHGAPLVRRLCGHQSAE